jgi:acylphosphatase
MNVYLVVHGRVQGVGYRWFVKQQADKLGITGFVRNRPAGSVEAFGVFVNDAQLDSFVKAIDCQSTSFVGMHVERVDVFKENDAGFRGFDVGDEFEIRF